MSVKSKRTPNQVASVPKIAPVELKKDEKPLTVEEEISIMRQDRARVQLMKREKERLRKERGDVS